MGAERHLEPKLLATLLSLRRRLIAEWGIATAAETMLVDLAILSYYRTVQAQRWMGDLALLIEHEFFGQDSPTPKGQRRVGHGLAVEEQVRRLGEQLMPLSDRANRMFIRNLKAIKELRIGPNPSIASGRVAGHRHRPAERTRRTQRKRSGRAALQSDTDPQKRRSSCTGAILVRVMRNPRSAGPESPYTPSDGTNTYTWSARNRSGGAHGMMGQATKRGDVGVEATLSLLRPRPIRSFRGPGRPRPVQPHAPIRAHHGSKA